MARELSSAIQTAIASPTMIPLILVRADFDSGPLRLHSGYGTITFNSEDYLGVGHLGKISQVEEGLDLATASVSFELSGIPSEHLALALGEHYVGRKIQAWLGVFLHLADGTMELQADPFEFFTGRMDTMTIEEGAETSTIAIAAESELVDLTRSRERRYTHEEVRLHYPSEMAFEYVAGLQEKTINWGKVYKDGEQAASTASVNLGTIKAVGRNGI